MRASMFSIVLSLTLALFNTSSNADQDRPKIITGQIICEVEWAAEFIRLSGEPSELIGSDADGEIGHDPLFDINQMAKRPVCFRGTAYFGEMSVGSDFYLPRGTFRPVLISELTFIRGPTWMSYIAPDRGLKYIVLLFRKETRI